MNRQTKVIAGLGIVLGVLIAAAVANYRPYSLRIVLSGNTSFDVVKPVFEIDSYLVDLPVLKVHSASWTLRGGYSIPTKAIVSWQTAKAGKQIRKMMLPKLPAELRRDEFLVLCLRFDAESEEALFYWGDYFTSDESYMKGKVGDCDVQATKPIRGEAIETDDWEKVFGEKWPVR